jgi:hypothetical protein
MDIWNWISNQRDRAAAIAVAVIGAIAIIAGWFGVSRSVLTTQQIPYLASGAVGGIFLLGVGATLWLSADLRDEWRKLDQIHADIQESIENQSSSATSNGNAKSVASESRTARKRTVRGSA